MDKIKTQVRAMLIAAFDKDAVSDKIVDEITAFIGEVLNEKVDDKVAAAVEVAEAEIADKAADAATEIFEENVEEVMKILDEELAAYKQKTERKYESEIAKLVENISKYLEFYIDNAIPEDLLIAEAKVATFEPIIDSIRTAFAESALGLDSEAASYVEELKMALEESEAKRSKLIEEKLDFATRLKEAQKNEAISTIVSELPVKYRDQMRELLETKESAEEVKNSWESLFDALIQHSTGSKTTRRRSLRESRSGRRSLRRSLSDGTLTVDRDRIRRNSRQAIRENQKPDPVEIYAARLTGNGPDDKKLRDVEIKESRDSYTKKFLKFLTSGRTEAERLASYLERHLVDDEMTKETLIKDARQYVKNTMSNLWRADAINWDVVADAVMSK